MQSLDVHAFDDFNPQSIGRRTLFEDPVMRVVLVSLHAGQGLPEHPANGLVTVYAISGRVRFHQGGENCALLPGSLVRLAPGSLHRIEAEEDSRLLVTAVAPADEAVWNSLAPRGRDLDLRHTPRQRRHSTVFYAFDQLALGEVFFIVNDHDPQPLRFQMEQAYPGELAWDYEVRGPELFRIKVARIAPRAA